MEWHVREGTFLDGAIRISFPSHAPEGREINGEMDPTRAPKRGRLEARGSPRNRRFEEFIIREAEIYMVGCNKAADECLLVVVKRRVRSTTAQRERG